MLAAKNENERKESWADLVAAAAEGAQLKEREVRQVGHEEQADPVQGALRARLRMRHRLECPGGGGDLCSSDES
jgi:hypothetical protein